MYAPLRQVMQNTISIVQTTKSDELNDAEIGFWSQSIIDSNLTQCADIKKLISIFRQEGKIHSTPKWQIQMASSEVSKDKLISEIKSNQPYGVAKILCWPSESTKEYLDWVKGD